MNHDLDEKAKCYLLLKKQKENLFNVFKDFKKTISSDLKLFKKIGVTKKYLSNVFIFYIIIYLLKGVGIGLLIPIAQGIIKQDYSFIWNNKFFSFIPNIFSSILNFSNWQLFIFLSFLVLFVTILRSILTYYFNLKLYKDKLKCSTNMNKYVYESYLGFGKKFFDENNPGKEASKLILMPARILGLLQSYDNLIRNFIEIVILLGLMSIISFRITLLGIFLVPITFLATKKMSLMIKSRATTEEEGLVELPKQLYNSFVKIPLTKAYNKEEYEKKKFEILCNNYENNRYSMQKIFSLMSPMHEILMFIAAFIFVSFLGFFSFQHNGSQVAEYLVLFYLFNTLLRNFTALISTKFSVNRISAGLKVLTENLYLEKKYFVDSGTKKINKFEKSIEIKNLNFSYKKGVAVLNNLNLKINNKEKISIVGKSGAGKSTIVSLLLNFYKVPPNSIFIDGIDINKISLNSLRNLFSYVSQDTIIFDDTILNNIAYGEEKISEKKLKEVIEKAQLKDFISNLPEKLNTLVGDRGIKLSGGEKQRIAIARALLKESPIIIFDEATSSLDSKTESLIKKAMDEIMDKRTGIIIAHRLSTVKNSDRIIVLEKGTVIEEGTFDNLYKQKGVFSKMLDLQKL